MITKVSNVGLCSDNFWLETERFLLGLNNRYCCNVDVFPTFLTLANFRISFVSVYFVLQAFITFLFVLTSFFSKLCHDSFSIIPTMT